MSDYIPWCSDRGQEGKRAGRIPYRDEGGSRPRRRAGADAGATLNPFKAKAEPAGQTIEVKKKQSAWPFSDNKFTGNRGDPPRGRGMKGGQKGKRFHYGIVVTCQGPSGPREVIIDPDMYVR